MVRDTMLTVTCSSNAFARRCYQSLGHFSLLRASCSVRRNPLRYYGRIGLVYSRSENGYKSFDLNEGTQFSVGEDDAIIGEDTTEIPNIEDITAELERLLKTREGSVLRRAAQTSKIDIDEKVIREAAVNLSANMRYSVQDIKWAIEVASEVLSESIHMTFEDAAGQLAIGKKTLERLALLRMQLNHIAHEQADHTFTSFKELIHAAEQASLNVKTRYEKISQFIQDKSTDSWQMGLDQNDPPRSRWYSGQNEDSAMSELLRESKPQEIESKTEGSGIFAWSPIAESINGRSAIAGMLISLLIELTSHKPITTQLITVGEDFHQISPGVGLFLLPPVVIITMVASFLPKVSENFNFPDTSDTMKSIEIQGGRCCMMLFWLVLALEAGKGGALV